MEAMFSPARKYNYGTYMLLPLTKQPQICPSLSPRLERLRGSEIPRQPLRISSIGIRAAMYSSNARCIHSSFLYLRPTILIIPYSSSPSRARPRWALGCEGSVDITVIALGGPMIAADLGSYLRTVCSFRRQGKRCSSMFWKGIVSIRPEL